MRHQNKFIILNHKVIDSMYSIRINKTILKNQFQCPDCWPYIVILLTRRRRQRHQNGAR